jgi:hypothetical protein
LHSVLIFCRRWWWRCWRPPIRPPPQGPTSWPQQGSLPTFTGGTALTQWESSWAFTGETSRRVLANTLRPAQVDIRGAFVVIYRKQKEKRGHSSSPKLFALFKRKGERCLRKDQTRPITFYIHAYRHILNSLTQFYFFFSIFVFLSQ